MVLLGVACGAETSTEAEPCDGILEGNYAIANQNDVDALNNCSVITGNLVVFNNAALTSFTLNALTSVGGDLTVEDNSALTSFTLT
jgi:hypothetical protein